MITTILAETDGCRRVLTHYAPGEECRAHRHAGPQMSLLLAGSYIEDSAEGVRALAGPGLSCKPGGFEHQNRFGEDGALILSIQAEASDALATAYRVAGLETRAEGLRLLDQATAAGPPPQPPQSEPPTARAPGAPCQAWVHEARDRLLAEPQLSVAGLARAMGVHPIHLARRFRAAFGRPPASVRRDVRAARAIDRIVRSTAALAEIALAEGYSDQAHMTRVVGRITGWSPGGLRRLLAP